MRLLHGPVNLEQRKYLTMTHTSWGKVSLMIITHGPLHLTTFYTLRKKVLQNTFSGFRLSQIEDSIQYLEGPNSAWHKNWNYLQHGNNHLVRQADYSRVTVTIMAKHLENVVSVKINSLWSWLSVIICATEFKQYAKLL